MSGIFGRSSALSGDPWDVPAILDAWSTPATLENQPPADSGPAPRTQCGEGETLDANTGTCVKLTSTDVKTVAAPAAAAASSTSKITFGQALPYVLGAAAAGVLLMVLMGKKKMTANRKAKARKKKSRGRKAKASYRYGKKRMKGPKRWHRRSSGKALVDLGSGVYVSKDKYAQYLMGDIEMDELRAFAKVI